MSTATPTEAATPHATASTSTDTATVTASTNTDTASTTANSASTSTSTSTSTKYPRGQNPRLRYQQPYWWPYRTYVKRRWIGRELLEVVSTEFRDRSVEYYRHALESGVTRVNDAVASPDLVLRDNDRIDNTVHRHEPPITNDPILVLHIDQEREFVVISKPGSIPVHATGRYFRHTVLEIMKADHGITCYSVNRLDRLTSGLMILALTSRASRDLSEEFLSGKVQKEYVARVRGKFPEGEIDVDQPLLTVDRQMGLVIITPEGKEARTIFKRMSYDPIRDESVVHCRPMTGRTHQIRVHLQYLGHPIPNDPLYAQEAVWGPNVGRGGVELAGPGADGESSASALHDAISARIVQIGQTKKNFADPSDDNREYSNIDVGSPIRLSTQAKEIIAKLRRQKDEQEDWVKWKEVIFKVKSAQEALAKESDSANVSKEDDSANVSKQDDSANVNKQDESANVGKEDESANVSKEDDSANVSKEDDSANVSKQDDSANVNKQDESANVGKEDESANVSKEDDSANVTKEDESADSDQSAPSKPVPHPRASHTKHKAVLPDPLPEDTPSPLKPPAYLPEGFCKECYVPVPDDPDPETLFIYLHALRYTTERLGVWETPLPRWAGADWDGKDWRGWVESEKPSAI